jgi:monovalent cation:proton antiporter-2 (CPA2) family protein
LRLPPPLFQDRGMDAHTPILSLQLLVFLAAAVCAPPIFNRLGLGVIVGYLAAGIMIGPFALGVFRDPGEILRVAELGVVLLLFVIGLELELARLVALRGDIVVLGISQLALTTAVIAIPAALLGLPPVAACIAGFSLALSSTAIAVKVLEDRGHVTRPYGQRSFAVLLTQDMAIVPILALVPVLAGHGEAGFSLDGTLRAIAAIAVFAVALVAGRRIMDPVLRALARSGARETMIAAALLLVFGAAMAANAAGLSMALGAFLGGLVLAESIYRHELEADVEPFRGLLLALFFMGVGMNLDLHTVVATAPLLLAGLVLVVAAKMLVAVGIARMSGSPLPDALRIGALLAPASEFTFVLLPIAAGEGLLDAGVANFLAALAALSMMIGPPLAAAIERLLPRFNPPTKTDAEAEANFDEVGRGEVLVLGFGRFGQIAAQLLLNSDIDTTLIDGNADRIRLAARFGFKVYYGDATRLDVLHAAGAGRARVILVCVENPAASLAIVDLVQRDFPLAKILVRSYDRAHSLALTEKGVDYELRETYESSILFGRAALEALGMEPAEAAAVAADVRRRDAERFARQRAEGMDAGTDLIHQKVIRPEPLIPPARIGRVLNPDAAGVDASERDGM